MSWRESRAQPPSPPGLARAPTQPQAERVEECETTAPAQPRGGGSTRHGKCMEKCLLGTSGLVSLVLLCSANSVLPTL